MKQRLHVVRRIRRLGLALVLSVMTTSSLFAQGAAPTADPQPQVGEAVDAGLAWLAKQQQRDGRWDFAATADPGAANQSEGATGLALLCFLRAGHTHENGAYKKNVSSGLGYLGGRIRGTARGAEIAAPVSGNIEAPGRYAHPIGVLAMCEAYAQTKDKRLRRPIDSTVRTTLAGQSSDDGGWGYGWHKLGSTFMAGWHLEALRAAENAGMKVPPQTFDRAKRYLAAVEKSRIEPRFRGQFSINVLSDQSYPATESIGLLWSLRLGAKPDDATITQGLEHVVKTAGHMDALQDPHFHLWATWLMHELGGNEWNTWRRQRDHALLGAQAKEGAERGSWYAKTRRNVEADCGRLGLTCYYLLQLQTGLEKAAE